MADGDELLADDTEIAIELIGIDPPGADLSFKIGETSLGVGGRAVLGNNGADLHADVESRLALPGSGQPTGTFSANFPAHHPVRSLHQLGACHAALYAA